MWEFQSAHASLGALPLSLVPPHGEMSARSHQPNQQGGQCQTPWTMERLAHWNPSKVKSLNFNYNEAPKFAQKHPNDWKDGTERLFLGDLRISVKKHPSLPLSPVAKDSSCSSRAWNWVSRLNMTMKLPAIIETQFSLYLAEANSQWWWDDSLPYRFHSIFWHCYFSESVKDMISFCI